MFNKKKVGLFAGIGFLCATFLLVKPISKFIDMTEDSNAATNTASEVVEGVHIWTTYPNYAVMQEPSSMIGDEIVPPSELSCDSNLNLSVTMGKGEIEGTQIILSPTKDIASYDLKISELTCGDDVIEVDQIDVYNQYYIYAVHEDTLKFRSVPQGWYPDMLVPFDKAKEYGENKVSNGKNQGITVEFHTTAETKAGIYEGTFVLTVDGTDVQIPVRVDVHDIDLTTTHNMGASAASMGPITKETYEMLMNNYRICTQYAYQAASSPEAMVEAVKEYWDNPHFTNYDIPNVSAARFKAYVKALAKASDSLEHNYLTKAICYFQDLDESQDYPKIISTVQSFNAAKEEVKDELYTYFETDELRDAVFSAIDNIMLYITPNTWVKKHLLSEYQAKENSLTFVAGGRELSTDAQYNEAVANSFRSPWIYANFGFPAMNSSLTQYRYSMRYMSWLIAKQDLGGWLYWDMDLTAELVSGEKSIESYTARDYYHDGYSYSSTEEDVNYIAFGDGQQIYPAKKYGEPDKWYPSTRITSFRDGVEDNEALYQLEQIYNELCTKYSVTGIDFDDMVAWIYDKGLEDGIDCYTDDGGTVCQMRDIVFKLYDLAKSDKAFLLTGINLTNSTQATVTFYTNASNVKCNDEVVISNNGKYIYTWDVNDNKKITIQLDDVFFQATAFEHGTLIEALDNVETNLRGLISNVGDFFSGKNGDDNAASVTFVQDTKTVKISINKTTTDPARALPSFSIKPSIFGVTDLFDTYYIRMTMRLKVKSAIDGKIPMKVMLIQDDGTENMFPENIFEWDQTTADEDGWMEQTITLKISREPLENVSELQFQFQDYHLNWYHMGADVEIADLYYTKYADLRGE